jgi:signal transduction histidine kinase
MEVQTDTKARILVVEDDTNLLEGIRTVLELDGYDVTTAENGKQALDLLRSTDHHAPQLIVSDIMMPIMSGIDLLVEVRREPAWVSIPFIFLTARSERSDVQRGKQLGVDDYLIKPFDAPDLLIAVESRLRRHQAINAVANGAMTDLKQRILTILNHEFRTPLTFIVAYADMLNNADSYSLSNSEILTFLRGVNSGAVRLRRLIENFIQLVEMETGDGQRNFDMRRTVIEDVSGFVRVAVEEFFRDAPSHTPVFELADDLPGLIVDPVYLKSAIIQLLDNAAKFSPESSAITIGVRNETLPTGQRAVCIWVRDAGRGISVQEQEHIWDAFYQIDRKVYEDQGTGSGLAIVRAVARLHGGAVDVQSKLGEGSTFSIMLPVSRD